MPGAKADDNGEKKFGSYAEVSAMKFNLKEERYLQKNLHIINVEKQFALNLINLDSRDVKIRYKKLKDKVERTKSYLTATEISELRTLDESGKLERVYTSVTPNLQSRINAEAKRLKINPRPSRPSTVAPVTRTSLLKQADEAEDRLEIAPKIRPQSDTTSLLRRETIRNALLRSDSRISTSTNATAVAPQRVRRYRKSQQSLSDSVSQYRDDTLQTTEYGVYDPAGERIAVDPKPKPPLRRSQTQIQEKPKHVVTINRSNSQKEMITASLTATQVSLPDDQKQSSDVPSVSSANIPCTDNNETIVPESAPEPPPRRPKNRPSRPISSVQGTTIEEGNDLDDDVFNGDEFDHESTVIQPEKGKMKIMKTKTFTADQVAEIRQKGSARSNGTTPTLSTKSATQMNQISKQKHTAEKAGLQTTNNEQTTSLKRNFRKYRPATTTGVVSNQRKTEVTQKRPQTSKSFRVQSGKSLKPNMNRSNSCVSASQIGSTNQAFSCHTAAEKDARERLSPVSAPGETGRTNQLTDEIQDALGENIHKELRKDLLQKEQEVAARVGDKVTCFMKQLDSYLKRVQKEATNDPMLNYTYY